MTRQIKLVQYRKWKSPNSSGTDKYPGYVGRVHLMYYNKDHKHWYFACGKDSVSMFGYRGDIAADYEPVTCRSCVKAKPEIVEKMDTVPEIEEM